MKAAPAASGSLSGGGIGGFWLSAATGAARAPTRNNFVAKKNKKKKNHLEIVFGTTLLRSANF